MKNKNIQLLFKNIFIFYYNIVSRYFREGFLRSSREFLAIFSILSRNSWSVWSQLFLKPTSVASLWLPHSLVLEIKVGLIREHTLMMSDDFCQVNKRSQKYINGYFYPSMWYLPIRSIPQLVMPISDQWGSNYKDEYTDNE